VRMRFKPGSLYNGEYTVNNIAYDAQGIRYYALNGLTGFHWERCLEEVPAETWRDVTAECDLQTRYDESRIWHGGEVAIEPRAGYRLRKVQLLTPVDKLQQAAFIVEKREP
jgi:hypothetical protein